MSEVRDFYASLLNVIQDDPSRKFYIHGQDIRTYGDLLTHIRSACGVLKSANAKRVCICADKSFETYAAIFAVILTGNTWVPLSPALPAARMNEILSIGEIDLVITDGDLPPDVTVFCENKSISMLSHPEVFDNHANSEMTIPNVGPDDTAMIYFTSGSTGRPKGVPITHLNYILNVENILQTTDLKPGAVFGDYHDLSFVISIPVLFPCLATGGALVPGKSLPDQMNPINSIVQNGVDVLITVPSTLARMMKLSTNRESLPALDILISCGEPLHLDVLRYCAEDIRPARFYNFYGSTEVAPWSFCHKIESSDTETYADVGIAPIGHPIPGNDVKISDEGELWISTAQLTPGYLGGVDTGTFVQEGNRRWYKTGDRAVERNGVFICKGRMDSQVKINGYRIDLLDIEANLKTLKDVERAFCFVIGSSDRPQIAAAIFGKTSYRQRDVVAQLKDRLPNYMIPKMIRHFSDMPYNKSGKLDRTLIKTYFEME